MRLTLRGRHVELSDSLRDYAERRLRTLGGYLSADVLVEVELSEETRARHLAEGTVFAKGQTLRASAEGANLRVAIDKLAANLERQALRYREKRREEPRRRSPGPAA